MGIGGEVVTNALRLMPMFINSSLRSVNLTCSSHMILLTANSADLQPYACGAC